MTYSVLELEASDGIGTLWLANPERRNAMGPAFWEELPLAMNELSSDPDVRVVVVAARGDHFTVGLDLKAIGPALLESAEPTPSGGARGRLKLLGEIERLQRAISSVADCPKPVLAAVHGYCLGGGVDLITACDIRVASQDAIFSVRETRIAIVADVGTLQRLPRIVGKGMAAELAYTGDDVNAQRAAEIGLVNSLQADPAACRKTVHEMASRIARNSPLAVQGTKRVLRYCEGKSVEDGLAYVATWNSAFLASDDLREAFAAFLDKRAPRFTGR
jgi:enoyl-CoA hydratase